MVDSPSDSQSLTTMLGSVFVRNPTAPLSRSCDQCPGYEIPADAVGELTMEMRQCLRAMLCHSCHPPHPVPLRVHSMRKCPRGGESIEVIAINCSRHPASECRHILLKQKGKPNRAATSGAEDHSTRKRNVPAASRNNDDGVLFRHGDVEVLPFVQGVDGRQFMDEIVHLLSEGRIAPLEAASHIFEFIRSYVDGVLTMQEWTGRTVIDVKRENGVMGTEDGKTHLVDPGALGSGLEGKSPIVAALAYMDPTASDGGFYGPGTPTYAFGQMMAAAVMACHGSESWETPNFRSLHACFPTGPKTAERVFPLMRTLVTKEADSVQFPPEGMQVLSARFLCERKGFIRELRQIACALDTEHRTEAAFRVLAEAAIAMIALEPADRPTLTSMSDDIMREASAVSEATGLDAQTLSQKRSAIAMAATGKNTAALVHAEGSSSNIALMKSGDLVIHGDDGSTTTIPFLHVVEQGLESLLKDLGVVPDVASHLHNAFDQYRAIYALERTEEEVRRFPGLIHQLSTEEGRPVLAVEPIMDRHFARALEGWIDVRPLSDEEMQKHCREEESQAAIRRAFTGVVRKHSPGNIFHIEQRDSEWFVTIEGHDDVIDSIVFHNLQKELHEIGEVHAVKVHVRQHSTSSFLHLSTLYVARELRDKQAPEGISIMPELLPNDTVQINRPLRIQVLVPPPDANLQAVQDIVDAAKMRYPGWHKLQIDVQLELAA